MTNTDTTAALTFTAPALTAALAPHLIAETTPDGRVVVREDGELIVVVMDDDTTYVDGVLTFTVATTSVLIVADDGGEAMFDAEEAVGDVDRLNLLASYTDPDDVAQKIAVAITESLDDVRA